MTRKIAVLGCVFWLVATVTNSCSWPSYDIPEFSLDNAADAPRAKYVLGQLGIVGPKFGGAYLVIAWRYLADKPLTRAEATEAARRWNENLDGAPLQWHYTDPVSDWLKARQTVVASAASVQPDQITTVLNFNVNCAEDAFRTAIKTLHNRAREFGVETARSWLAAQDVVFSNCGGGNASVPPAPASLPEKLRLDRDYQIAAAHFYANDYDHAHELFLAIGRNPRSPWRGIARVVAARALVRSATWTHQSDDAARLREAEAELKAILAEEHDPRVRRAAGQLYGFVAVQIDPAARAEELARKVETNVDAQSLTDYLVLRERDQHPSGEMTEWIEAMGAEENAFAKPFERWRETHSLPWLLAAMVHATATDPRVEQLLAASALVDESSPAYLTIAYHRARILLTRNDREDARHVLDRALTHDLGPSSRNALLALRLPLAATLKDFMADAVRTPATFDNEFQQVAPYPMLDQDAANVLSFALPLEDLVRAAHVPDLDAGVRTQILSSAFTRALILRRDDVAVKVAPDLRRAMPMLAPFLLRFERAPAASRRFEGTNILVAFPGLSPYVSSGETRVMQHVHVDNRPATDLLHEYRNYWCIRNEAPYGDDPPSFVPPPAFASDAATIEAAAAERRALEHAGGGSTYLLRSVLQWAKARPHDRRVPEALATAIYAAHWTCPDADTKKTAARAYDLLHAHYPKSQAAQRTKYFYAGF